MRAFFCPDPTRRCKPRSEAALAGVTAQGAGKLRRLALLLQSADPLTLADGLAMDRVLQPLEERFKLVGSPLQGLDAPLVPRIRRLGSRVRGPPAATQLNNASEDRQTRAPAAHLDCRNSPWSRTSGCLFLGSRARGGGSKTQRAVQAAPASSPRFTVSQRPVLSNHGPSARGGWSSNMRTGPAVDPVRLNSGLPRRAGSRAWACYRCFGRNCWPQGQLKEGYSSGWVPAVSFDRRRHHTPQALSGSRRPRT